MADPTPTDRLEWSFKPSQVLDADSRQARALEYIAHYLDRIESHLAQITETLTVDPPEGFTIMRALQDIADAAKASQK